MNEVVLSNLDGIVPGQRVQVVLAQDLDGMNQFELRQQSWSEGVGWFTQSTLMLDARQVSKLKTFLGDSRGNFGITQPRAVTQALPPKRTCFANGFEPRLVDAG